MGPLSSGNVEYDGCEDTDDPEIKQTGVDLPGAEDTAGSDEAPDDAGVEEDACLWASEMIGLPPRADVSDATEGPIHYTNLHKAGPDSGNGLRHEHGTGWNFHVVTQFQVLYEVNSLNHGDVAISLEQHHRSRPTGLHVPNYEFWREVEVSESEQKEIQREKYQ